MKTNETNIPTLEAQAQKKVWLPLSHEDIFREKDHQETSKSGPKRAQRLTFPKKKRLLTRRDFQRFSYSEKRLVGKFLCIDYRKAPVLRLGITASSKYGNSPERNRFKRLVREAFRKNYYLLPQTIEIRVLPRAFAKKASLFEIEKELTRLFHVK